jgi:hypothetical protein
MSLQVIQGEGQRAPTVDKDLVKFCEELLAEAKQGLFESIAAVTVVDGEPHIMWAGAVDDHDCEIVYGLEQLKYSLVTDEEE